MRKELELIETIENYLKGNLSETDKVAFEKKINENPELKKEVELQKQVLKGIERAGLKQSAKQGLKKHKFNKGLKNWGLGGLAIVVIALSSVFVYNAVTKSTHKENAAYDLPELNEQGEKLWSDADKYLEPQNFELNADQDTVVETADGIVIAIPANSFLDANGQPAKGKIQLEVKEALNAADIMKAGLNTKSDDKLLETGGMFYINARQDGASLKIDSKNPLYAEIPTDEVKPGMQLFEGKRLADGSIDWVNPKPIVKDLIPVDILSLNFYPPNYLDSLKNWEYNNKDKKFTDSLYYSFASLFGSYSSLSDKLGDSSESSDWNWTWKLKNKKNGTIVNVPQSKMSDDTWLRDYDMVTITASDPSAKQGETIFKQNCAVCHSMGSDMITGPGMLGVLKRVPSEEWMLKYIKNNFALKKSGDAYANQLSKMGYPSAMTVFTMLPDEDIKNIIEYIKTNDPSVAISKKYVSDSISGINPASIKTVWNTKFNNTLLATREFEERIPLIHNTCNGNVLDTYINNLDKSLSAIDSALMQQYPEFAKFAARGDGKVKNENTNVELLKRYYKEKSKAYTDALTKTQNEFLQKQSEADRDVLEKRNDYTMKDAERIADNFQKELNTNMDEAYRQLGKKRPKDQLRLKRTQPTYGTPIETVGWKNVDSYVLESTLNRTTLDYTDPQTGKKAVIKYEPLTVSVNDYKNYDRVLVYLLPEALNSFMRVSNKNEVFEEKLNELMTYKMVCIAYKGEESFYFSQDNVRPGSLSVSLVKTTNADIKNNLNKISKRSQSKAMNDELNYFAFEKEETKRQVELAKIGELTNKIRPVIFPCMQPAPAAPADTTEHYH